MSTNLSGSAYARRCFHCQPIPCFTGVCIRTHAYGTPYTQLYVSTRFVGGIARVLTGVCWGAWGTYVRTQLGGPSPLSHGCLVDVPGVIALASVFVPLCRACLSMCGVGHVKNIWPRATASTNCAISFISESITPQPSWRTRLRTHHFALNAPLQAN